MSDVEILCNAYLGTPFAQSLSAEVGEDTVKAIWLDGYGEAQDRHFRDNQAHLERLSEHLRNLHSKEAADKISNTTIQY